MSSWCTYQVTIKEPLLTRPPFKNAIISTYLTLVRVSELNNIVMNCCTKFIYNEFDLISLDGAGAASSYREVVGVKLFFDINPPPPFRLLLPLSTPNAEFEANLVQSIKSIDKILATLASL